MAQEAKKNIQTETSTLDWAARTVDIKRQGTAIVLPADPAEMGLLDGAAILKRAHADEMQQYAIHEHIPVHFFDGIVALFAVMKEKYGYVGTQAKQTWWGEIPPQLLHVKVGPKPEDFLQVPFGQFKLPGVDAIIETKYEVVKGIPQLAIVGEVRAKERKIVMELVLETQRYARENSIYKGRCIKLHRDDSNGVDLSQPLEYFDPFAGKEIPIFNRVTEQLIETALLTPIANADVCRKHKVPLKRGVLLEGPYGTGKSLTAKQAARVASENGWTFVLVDNVKAIKYALNFAKMYQPCVLFAEDIDRLVGSRNEGANDLINDIDGVVGKDAEIITVLTTNFVEKIDKAMLRPGRLDAVISLKAPDEEAVQRLINFYAGDLLASDTDLVPTAEKLAGNIPATIREVVERAKLGMIQRNAASIVTDDLAAAAESMVNHLNILNDAKEGALDPTIEEMLASLVKTEITKVIRTALVPQVLTGK
jgi:hypothetical protein